MPIGPLRWSGSAFRSPLRSGYRDAQPIPRGDDGRIPVPPPLSAFHSETGPLYAPTIPNDCIVDLVDESGNTIQRLYARMVFDSFPQSHAKVRARAADSGTALAITYVMPLLLILFHRSLQFFCTIGGLVLLRGWLWVLRHG
jgi:hypothetical protein